MRFSSTEVAAEISAAYQRAGGATSAPHRIIVSQFPAEPFKIDGALLVLNMGRPTMSEKDTCYRTQLAT